MWTPRERPRSAGRRLIRGSSVPAAHGPMNGLLVRCAALVLPFGLSGHARESLPHQGRPAGGRLASAKSPADRQFGSPVTAEPAAPGRGRPLRGRSADRSCVPWAAGAPAVTMRAMAGPGLGRAGVSCLVGRERECAAIDGLLRDARAGIGGSLVVRGEPGIGKSTLLGYARQRAARMRVLPAGG